MAEPADKHARVVGYLGLLVATMAAFFAYTSSPFYKGTQPQLVFAFQRTNSGPDGEGWHHGHLQVRIRNLSANPAKNVYVGIRTLGTSIPIKCIPNHSITEESDGIRMVKLELIPPNGHVDITASTRLKAGEADPLGYEIWRDAPSVISVYGEFGPAQFAPGASSSNVQVSPGLGGDSFL